MIKINDIPIQTPTEFKVSSFLISDFDRNALGDGVIDVKNEKRRLEFEYRIISQANLALISSLLRQNPVSKVEYPDDPYLGTDHTIMVYRGDIVSKTGQKLQGTRLYENVSFALIEM